MGVAGEVFDDDECGEEEAGLEESIEVAFGEVFVDGDFDEPWLQEVSAVGEWDEEDGHDEAGAVGADEGPETAQEVGVETFVFIATGGGFCARVAHAASIPSSSAMRWRSTMRA